MRTMLLKCRDLAEVATPYLDGGLPPGTRLAARIHLRLCEACRHYLEQMRQTIRFLGSGPDRVPPENESKIMELVDAAGRDK
jgi:anti-sigma factor RsiW